MLTRQQAAMAPELSSRPGGVRVADSMQGRGAVQSCGGHAHCLGAE